MALPKIKHPTYAITIPSTKQEVNIRPFTVQEEKLLMMAKSSENSDDIINAVKQIIRNSVIEAIDVDRLSTFDIEYIFLKLRSKSVGEVVDLEYKVPETEEVIRFKVNLDEIQVQYNPKHSNKFTVHGDIGVQMRYPTLNEIKLIESSQNQDQAVLEILFKCIDKIYDNDNVYDDFSDQELEEFVNSLPMDSMIKIRDFFETMPSVEHTVKLKNKDGKSFEVVLKGLNNFFT
jgi:hypothetical protein